MTDLPEWQSHKIVRADKIVRVIHNGGDYSSGHIEENSATVIQALELACGAVVGPLPENFFARGYPAFGDYYVVYEDGYVSWSPAKAFEDGYTRIE